MDYIILDQVGQDIVTEFNNNHEAKAIICSTIHGEGIVAYTLDLLEFGELVDKLKDYPVVEVVLPEHL